MWNLRSPIALFFSLLCVASAAAADALSPPIVNTNNHHTYILLASSTWSNAEAQAVSLGGHLATLRNQAEEDWVFQTFGSYGGKQRLLWIGLSDRDKKFHFTWSSGESVAYTQWAPGEPNNVGSGEDFVAIFYPHHSQAGKWNDWSDRRADPIGLPFNGVVEIIPQDVPANAGTVCPSQGSVEIRLSLTITNLDCNIQLSWPLASAGYFLEATTNMAVPFTMFGYSEATNTDLGILSVTITNPGPQMFFRLHKP